MVKTPPQYFSIPLLENGDKLTCYEFERRYNAMSDVKKAELIEGIVYIKPAALRFRSHGQPHGWIIGCLGTYEAATPSVALGVEPTVRLDLDNEPQPDAVPLMYQKTAIADIFHRSRVPDYQSLSPRRNGLYSSLGQV